MSSAGGNMDSMSDPSMATVMLFLNDGSNITFPAALVDYDHNYDVQSAINKGSQLGASLILLILLPILTKAEKRFSPIFVLNCLSLLFNFARLVLGCLFYTGPWRGFYVAFSTDYTSVPFWAYQISIAAPILTIPLMITAQTSLALQVQVVAVNLRRQYRRTIFCISVCVALCAIAFRIAGVIINAQQTLSMSNLDQDFWLIGANINATAASIFYFSAVFVTKLGLSLYQRYKLGLRRWGPMEIVFTMGFQTLLIPALFATLQYSAVEIPDMDSNIITAVVIFLPLSSIWAAASVGDNQGRNNNLALPVHERFGDTSTLQGSSSNASMFFRKNKRSSPLADTFTLEDTLGSASDSGHRTNQARSEPAIHEPHLHELGP